VRPSAEKRLTEGEGFKLAEAAAELPEQKTNKNNSASAAQNPQEVQASIAAVQQRIAADRAQCEKTPPKTNKKNPPPADDDDYPPEIDARRDLFAKHTEYDFPEGDEPELYHWLDGDEPEDGYEEKVFAAFDTLGAGTVALLRNILTDHESSDLGWALWGLDTAENKAIDIADVVVYHTQPEVEFKSLDDLTGALVDARQRITELETRIAELEKQ
jgi:hypothetical protein